MKKRWSYSFLKLWKKGDRILFKNEVQRKAEKIYTDTADEEDQSIVISDVRSLADESDEIKFLVSKFFHPDSDVRSLEDELDVIKFSVNKFFYPEKSNAQTLLLNGFYQNSDIINLPKFFLDEVAVISLSQALSYAELGDLFFKEMEEMKKVENWSWQKSSNIQCVDL